MFRTRDGGKTWENVLFKSPKTGAIDLVMSPSDPSVLFAALWYFERKPWTLYVPVRRIGQRGDSLEPPFILTGRPSSRARAVEA